MTTHEHQTLPDSQDQAQTQVQGSPPVSEAATVPSAPVGGQEQSQPIAPTDPSMAPEEAAPTGGPAAGATEYGEGTTSPQTGGPAHESASAEMLFADDDLAELRGRWAAVQAAFVDDPKQCVQKADVLVSDLVDQLTTSFAQARSRLEEQWARGEEASTEDLRLALMHYREFFERLLAV